MLVSQSRSGGGQSINTGTTNWEIGESVGLKFQGNIQEVIIWASDENTNQSGIETNINNYYSIYDTGLLVDYPDASAAYSVRQLTTAYTGGAMDIRRASDNTEQTIGFTSTGDLDTESIETFCNGTECYVATWYDQSGNENHAEQTNSGKQPQIYSGSAVITSNEKAAIYTYPPGGGMDVLNIPSSDRDWETM